ncbi:hypothetical protein H5410_041506 [Solanum commersonii]|uniref:Uncharacterized protein n=1 Tax=Solanum commersonii TaxID=4109 RepID=A0A9J5XUY4_SOLCO|nr:hypothetical protein H5410_041506 [Solanum commersonii]
MNIQRKDIVNNNRKEEYDIPQYLDILNKCIIPKIHPRIIYQMETFEKLNLKQVVKTTEETITIDSDYQTFRLLSENDLAPYREIYKFMHIDLVQKLSINVIDNDRVIELLQIIKNLEIRAQIIDKISNTSTSKNHITEDIPTKEGSYTMEEVKNLLLE